MIARIMDEETRRKLQGLLPFAPGAYVTETLEAFEDVEEAFRPRFYLRDLAPRHWAALRSALKAERTPDPEDMVRALLDGALVGWDNVFNSNFEPIPFEPEALASLPFPWIEALFWKCVTLCSPSRIEKEGLDSLPPPASDTSSNPARSAAAARA
jgi:hypothetical protein